jgi:L-threonylcarbamoyladenylate synthase
MAATILPCQDASQRAEAVRQAVAVLRQGGLVAFPTETVYGVAATVAGDEGLLRLRQLKERPADKPFSVHMPNAAALDRYVDLDEHPALRRVAGKTMPGPITLVVDVSDEVITRKLSDMALPAEARPRLYHGNTIGLRCPDHPVSEAFLGAVELPVVASSANRNGQPEPHTAEAAARAIGDHVALVLDGGPCRFSQPSTVARVRGDTIEVLRQGVYDQRYLQKLLLRSIVFLCSGNTCRSPMAQMIAEAELAARLGVARGELLNAGYEVTSAGVYAAPGSPATPEAVRAVEALGIDPKRHASRGVSVDMLQRAEVIYCMTTSHREAVVSLVPSLADRTMLLDEQGDVDDPIGSSAQAYLRTARRIQLAVRQRLDELDVPKAGKRRSDAGS